MYYAKMVGFARFPCHQQRGLPPIRGPTFSPYTWPGPKETTFSWATKRCQTKHLEEASSDRKLGACQIQLDPKNDIPRERQRERERDTKKEKEQKKERKKERKKEEERKRKKEIKKT